MIYLWLKAGHIIFVIFWMAGLFIAPRQLIYMQDAEPGSEGEKAWIKRTELLRKMILTPSLIAVWVFGLALAYTLGVWAEPWFHVKVVLVLALSGYHGIMVSMAKRMAKGERPMTPKSLRMWGEAPAIAMAFIVVLVVLQPF